ncbi:hemolysin [Taibaiella sp. KBW10]|uniref:GNAT family N-acetyltransferase n=1 Tax=Taibaiella sp. KBW10 TaxID=2153357 RepID=UPI000F5A9E6D|nr:GNAT family N-acetyltransferase [Taibaiella sp. KBW10]RQO30131.1 hemolysin [Taibaiella sp. KBW10]
MEEIIAPVSRALLAQELNEKTFLRKTNKGGNEIYIVNAQNAPNVLLEIGRLREWAFRDGGGGTGKPYDLDEYDQGAYAYQQLVVWSPEDKEIIGGYRYIKCQDALDEQGHVHLSTTHYFNFSDTFVTEYLSQTIELGRSFVQPLYQSKDGGKKGLFSLDNLWDGLGALVILHPEIKYFFGKVTMYKTFNVHARDHIMAFLQHYFPDKDRLLTAKPELKVDLSTPVTDFVQQLTGLEYKKGHLLLNSIVKEYGENIPPLVNSYMNLSSTMKTFDTANNPDFGDVEETCILISIKDIFPSKAERHVSTFQQQG